MDFLLLGGDSRQQYLARLLAQDGHRVRTWGLGLPTDEASPTGGAQAVILPLPAEEGEFLRTPLSESSLSRTELLDLLPSGSLVLAGRPSQELVMGAWAKGCRVMDYYGSEELAIANAVPTSEGAIRLAMEVLPVTLRGTPILVLGYGRIGKILCEQLRGLGSRVTVGARKSTDLAWLAAQGFPALRSDRLDQAELTGFPLLINTVPALLLDRAVLDRLSPQAAVLDLASAPGGVDREAAREIGIQVLTAPGLPGRQAPATAALAIREAIYHLLGA